ncbi:DUF349 domain-containing protein [Nesterenkonia sphaerica]|uniref:DUF349 domain-containing protein n=1 Tax=Nesterenkonia sphaerica TaxID=1804988 RepID=A0A5R9AKQ7_9MICC|nr:DUF349 domain-containing protein [Nesterenkonia sphaerica]TLP79392.1 DUF349 domain-containing protein [Nesterenkonia sphaerica]
MSPAIKPNYHQSSLDEVRARTRVDEEGHVYVLPTSEGAEEAYVGQFSAGDAEAALQYFTRKFDDLYNRALLLRARVATQADSASALRSSRATLSKELEGGTWVGDVAGLRGILEEITEGIEGIAAAEKKQTDEALSAKVAVREEIVRAAEELAAADPDRQHWKSAQERMSELFEQWKTEQRTPPRLPKPVEDPLWKRFREARSTFERHRKGFFVRRDKEAADIKRAKEELIAEAEKLQHSTDFGPTTKAYHRLMDRWKEQGRGPRKTEDAQWARFRAAQDVFFSARDAANAKVDAEYAENLKKKEEILGKLRELMPFTKPEAVRERYFTLIEAWDAAGKVPRGDVKRMERAIGEVQEAFREAEGATRSPRESARNDRQSQMIDQLEETISQLETDVAQADSDGDDKLKREAEEALAARRSWLQMLTSS